MAAHRNKVEPAVVIEVHERSAPFHPRKGRQRHSGRIRNIVEIPLPFVMKQIVIFLLKVRDVERRQTSMQIVADGDAHGCLLRAVFAHARSRLKPDISEFPVAVISI